MGIILDMAFLQWFKKYSILIGVFSVLVGVSLAGYAAMTHSQSMILLIICMVLGFVPLLFISIGIRRDQIKSGTTSGTSRVTPEQFKVGIKFVFAAFVLVGLILWLIPGITPFN